VLHAIVEHSAHHADCRIPTVELKECQEQLEHAYPEIIVEHFTFAYLRRILASCQLYDYENHCWLDFGGRRADESKE
jgi:omega-6 fatty acid desaturase (delta-12 desaturase)